MISYDFGAFRLEFDGTTGECHTRYPDGHSSGCGIVEGDRFHAPRLGITPQEHRLAHELLHHLLARARGYEGSARGCRIVWRDAHGEPQKREEADLDEWKITAMTYFVYGRPCEWGALMDLEREGVDPYALRSRALYFLNAARLHPAGVAISA